MRVQNTTNGAEDKTVIISDSFPYCENTCKESENTCKESYKIRQIILNFQTQCTIQ
jgi:hypothetical protein